MSTTTRTRAFLLLPATVAAALLLSSCGAGDDAAPPAPEVSEQATAGFNDADVMFAQMMIPHHEQAVAMSRLAEDRATADVRELAERIEAAQGPEIDRLNAMLESWSEAPADDMEGMDHSMDGMMTEEQMAALEQAEGTEFDTMFLEMMIDHHEGAVAMAREELDNGANPEARELAQSVVDAQEAEIEEMNALLGGDGTTGTDQGTDHSGH